MGFGGSKFPPLPPLTAPTPVGQSTLTAELQAAGRRSGLRSALLSRVGGGGTGVGSNRNQMTKYMGNRKLSGGE